VRGESGRRGRRGVVREIAGRRGKEDKGGKK